ncbi:hypothetical protein P245_20325 [Comamonas thiooxydans]|uniref:Nucleotidyltransferase-like domain-containing protein n=1 Tax=Comamonas thiooxydans TaxID=363952 RepID=A0A0E3BCD8_9BURK|nr:GSU2403 family nucleotidyltransferase fold protein [Comamonas thiooxydans]KGG87411.1 hypothetical protein P245_20325 [Comamonas thiooxydans]
MTDWYITEFTAEQKEQQQRAETVMLNLRECQRVASRDNYYWEFSAEGGKVCLVSRGKVTPSTLHSSPNRDLDVIHRKQWAKYESAINNLQAAEKSYLEVVEENKDFGIGSAEPIAIQILNKLHDYGVLHFHRVIGTHALFAYQSAAGVTFDDGNTSTQDIDMLWNRKQRMEFRRVLDGVHPQISMIEVLQTVDESFQRSEENSESAINADSFSVDFLRMEDKPRPETKDLQAVCMSDTAVDVMPVVAVGSEIFMRGQPFEKVVISYTGEMCLMPTIDPVIFAHFKQRMAVSADRDPRKINRDRTQSEAVVSLLNGGLLKTTLTAEDLRGFPVEGLVLPA